ncbi:MAG: helix-turn-helix transcriptional regulator [Balneolaceae bacterium]|nr:helix-turn-helix transcriptional regulator [Balneolaceae bacterium]
MDFQTLELQQELSKHVDSVFYLGLYNPEHEIERLLPDGTISLVIELDGKERHIYDNTDFEVVQTCRHSWLSGMHNKYISISALPDTELIGIRFKPGGFIPFIHSSVYKLYNKVVAASEYFPETIDSLRTSIITQDIAEDKLELVREWLHDNFEYADSVNTVIDNACRQIVVNPTLSTLQEIKSDLKYSEKQFIHLFKQQVGITPKIFQRITRFNQILPKIQEKETLEWVQISEECGYFDQSHFIRDFKRFSGFNPSEFLDSSSGRTNFIPIR